jgi:uncharacterized metal-binding protein
VLNAVLGTKFNIIFGYPGGNDVVLAMATRRSTTPLWLVMVERKLAHRAWVDENNKCFHSIVAGKAS